jgi:hypothetical protein
MSLAVEVATDAALAAFPAASAVELWPSTMPLRPPGAGALHHTGWSRPEATPLTGS